MRHKLVIFDCDGVLVDSEIISNRIVSETLTSLGYSITAEDCIMKFAGLNANSVRQIILNDSGIEIPSDYFALQQTLVLKAFETELISLAKPVLETIEKMNIRRCIASSSSISRITRSLELTNQLLYFTNQSIFTSQQVPKGKPAPDLFLFAANQMGFNPEDCIVIEDSSTGIEAAVAARMNVVGFLGGSHTHYSWYQEKIYAYGIPIAKNCDELLQQLKFINFKNTTNDVFN